MCSIRALPGNVRIGNYNYRKLIMDGGVQRLNIITLGDSNCRRRQFEVFDDLVLF